MSERTLVHPTTDAFRGEPGAGTLREVPWWAAWQVRVPEGERGPWSVRRVEVSEDAAFAGRLRAAFNPRLNGRYVPEGVYTQLRCGGSLVMSDTPDEICDHQVPVWRAKNRGGRVLIHGLGLGMVLGQMLALENVTGVDVVEVSEDVIALVAPTYRDSRLTIHHGDALTYRWPKGVRWNVVWHDIWADLCADNLTEMATLHRRFARRCDWQGSWGKALLRRSRSRALAYR